MMTDDKLVTEMLDEYLLRRLVHRYCRAVDRGDIAELRSLYHRDATDAHGGFSSGSAEQLIANIEAAYPHLRSMQHHVTTTNFAIDGDRAEGEIYTIATHTIAADGGDVDVVVGGRYLDRYAKTDGTWRIVERTVVTDSAFVGAPSLMDFSHPITRDTARGSVGDDDPSAGFFSTL